MTCLKFSLVCVLMEIIYATGSPLEDSCHVSRYEDVEFASRTCETLTLGTIVIPKYKTLNINMKDGTTLVFDGRISPEPAKWKGTLIHVTGRKIQVYGTANHLLDGLGAKFWKGDDEEVVKRPKLIRFSLEESIVHDLHLKNCPSSCMMISSKDLEVYRIFIDNKDGFPDIAGDDFAKYTVGFDVSGFNVRIINSTVYNQDDCVVARTGKNYHFENLHCNGSHGFSVSAKSGKIGNVIFKASHIENGPHAIHIKTHKHGAGLVYNVTYSSITFKNIKNEAIKIKQTSSPSANYLIKNLILHDIEGSLTSKESPAISIVCAEGGCTDWDWSDIKISGAKSNNACENVPSGVDC